MDGAIFEGPFERVAAGLDMMLTFPPTSTPSTASPDPDRTRPKSIRSPAVFLTLESRLVRMSR